MKSNQPQRCTVDTIKTEQEFYKKEVQKELKFEIALQMKNEGESIEKILKSTGLTKEEIENLNISYPYFVTVFC